MPTAIGPFLIQDADDGPGILTAADDGKLFMWSEPDKHVIMVAPPAFQQMIMRSGGYSIQQATDGPGALTIADNAKALVWNQATGHFIMSTVNAADADTLDGLDSTAFLLATGARSGATSQAQIFTNGIIGPTWKPSANSTSAIKIQNSDASSNVLVVDTTNGQVAFNTTPTDVTFDIYKASVSATMRIRSDTLDAWGLFIRPTARTAYVAFATTSTPTTPTFQFGVDGNDTRFSISGNNFFPQYLIVTTTSTEARLTDAGTNAVTTDLIMDHRSTNTPAAGFGVGFLARLHSTTTTAQSAGRLTWEWITATHASRAAAGKLSAFYISTERVGIYWEANSTDIVVGIGQSASLTAALDVVASTTTRASQRLRLGSAPTTPNDGDLWHDGALTFYATDATTAAIVDTLRLRRASSGTPAAGFGVGVSARLMSSTTANRDAGRLTWAWITATDASRAAQGQLSAFYTTTERPVITWGANSTVPLLSFYDVTTPIAKPTRGATLTNNVTAGGTTDQIDDFVGTLYATDAATIRNDIYQLARALRQLDVGLRALGLFT